MLKKIICIVMILSVITCIYTTVSATGVLGNIINQGTGWAGSGTSTGGIGEVVKEFLVTNIFPTISAIGNLVFAAVTVILGLKYIWSSAEGKADVQESLPIFVAAVIFFYLAGTLVGFATNITGGVSSATGWASLSGNVIWIINTVVKYAALAGLVVIGLKYMFASAEGRASLKVSMGGAVIGLLFVFMASNIINLFVTTASQIIK